ncbi:MAG: glycosyltransferase family 2 protein [Candidatus Eisenbacteria bacterium]|nr:glycosyltransferase family 2 protein [Candidatus Eisenbacteria bacterium]
MSAPRSIPPEPPAGQLALIDPARVAIVVPAWNEAGKIGQVVRRIPRRWAGCVIVVDDCSGDSTADEARAAGADVVLRHERNLGVGAGIRTGLLEAKRRGYEVAAVLSGDDQHVPDELPRILAPVFAGEADLVQGSRWLPGGATPGIPPARRWLTRLYPLLFRLASGFPVTDGTNGMRAFRLSLLDDPRIRLEQAWLDRYELEPYLLYQVVRTGHRVCEAPVTVCYHSRGTTKMKLLSDGWRILRPLVFLRLGLRH